MKNLVIAIDGPAASGKSTTSRLAAQRLGYLYVDTGAMYRAMTLKVLQSKTNLDDDRAIARIAASTEICLEELDGELRVYLDKRDVTEAIRSQEVTKAVSAVSMVKEVRECMVRLQRIMSKRGGVIVEGRDIGTVVLPEADLKFFMIADVSRRAMRRQEELRMQGITVGLDQLIGELRERDRKDSEREISPLRKSADAIEIDTSDLTIEDQVNFITERVAEVQLQRQ